MTVRTFPRWSDFAPLLRPRRIDPNPVRRRLAAAQTIGDLRVLARRRAPRAIFDYVDGGADREITLRRARRLFRAVEFLPQTLQGIDEVDLSTTFLGQPAAVPYVFSPTGVNRLMHEAGEIAVARSAARFGVPYGLSMVATTSPEDVATAAGDGVRWFSLSPSRNRAARQVTLDRVRAAGFGGLIAVVDTAAPGARLRDGYHGLTIPPQVTLRTFVDGALHPAWWWDFLTTPPLSFPAFGGHGGTVKEMSAQLSDPGASLADFAWLREQWDGPLLVKGILTPAEAFRYAEAGADAVVLSSHGGRQLDQVPVPLRMLPEVVEAVGGRAEVYVDTGVTHGADIAAALALGARGVFIGRAYLYGLMAAGEAGVDRVNEILREQLLRTLRLLGVGSVGELGPQHVRLP